MPPSRPQPQPTRFAIQKARGKGWTTLEVGEELDQARARFELMARVNPRAYFRLIQLDHNTDSPYGGMEFDWKLIALHDPARPARGGPARPAAAGRGAKGRRRAGERLRLPLRFYVAVIVAGGLAGLAAYLLLGTGYGLPSP